MKKIIVSGLVLCLLFLFPLSAFAAGATSAAGHILVPFTFSDVWQYSTPEHIDDALCERRTLDAAHLSEYMTAFDYSLWLVNGKNDAEITVSCSDAGGQSDYAALSDEALGALIQNEVSQMSVAPEFRLSRVEKYRSGGIPFVKYSVDLDGRLFSFFYRTVADGIRYTVRVESPEGNFPAFVQADALSVVDSLGTALTFPEQYEKAPVRTTVAATTASVTLIYDPDGDGEGTVLTPPAAETTGTVPPTTESGSPAGSEVGGTQSAGHAAYVEVGTNGETLPIEEMDPSVYAARRSLWRPVLAAAAVAAAVVLVCLVVGKRVVKKKKK